MKVVKRISGHASAAMTLDVESQPLAGEFDPLAESLCLGVGGRRSVF